MLIPMYKALLVVLLLALSGCAQIPNPCPPRTTYMRVFNSCAALPGARRGRPDRLLVSFQQSDDPLAVSTGFLAARRTYGADPAWVDSEGS
jgi:hypothetical protein